MLERLVRRVMTKLYAPREPSKRQPRPHFRPLLEALEDRRLLSTYTWNWQQNNATSNWSDGNNWIKAGNDAGTYPGQNVAGDVAVFDNTSSNPCTADVSVTLSSIAIASSFGSSVSFFGGGFAGRIITATGVSFMSSGALFCTNGKLVIGANGMFGWSAGTILGGGDGNTSVDVEGSISFTGTSDKTLNGAKLT
jgi:hypothetical protein